MIRTHTLTRHTLAAALLLTAAVPGRTGRAQVPGLAVETLGTGPYAHMHMLLEKTFLKVDVLTVDISFAADTANALRDLAAGRKPGPELTALIADRAARAEDAFVEVRFKRDVSLDDMVDTATRSLDRARRARFIDDNDFRRISTSLPRRFSFLQERGIKEGDRVLYRVQPSSMRVVYVDRSGRVSLDETSEGTAPRLGLLGGYFSPGSDFRDGLVASLFEKK